MSGILGGIHLPKVIPFYLVLVLVTPAEFSVLWMIVAVILDIVGQVL